MPASGPVIIAADHLSILDGVMISLLAPRPIAFVAKAECFRPGRLTRPLFTALAAVPVERSHRDRGPRWASRVVVSSCAMSSVPVANGRLPQIRR